MPLSNDSLTLTPRTHFDGPCLTFDFPGMLIGVAEYEEGPTGCTVFRFPGGVPTAIDVRGGMVGTTQENDYCSALCFAGGSLLGLEAASGVGVGIFGQGKHSLERGMGVINGAIIYDFGGRDNTIYPDKALGRAALESAQAGIFPLGARGAGRSAGVGGVLGRERAESSGHGGAFREVAGLKVGVFTVVNALGAVYNRDGQVVRGNRHPDTNQRHDVVADLETEIASGKYSEPRSGNTTLSLLVTNQKLPMEALTQLARQVHSSMARAIRPFHTMYDGDVLYAVTTNSVESQLSVAGLGLIASELAWDAILAAVTQD
ncbi:MAG: peptidase S58 [Chloroflexota bacterium]|nr:6-aminohexanoate hydrolase [Chloroflexota bacterium]NOG64000.1 6-aminohexanoate hydrolase [Chloroflexota bacterium]GIK65697.1 MAG: peptidase S58 [Chloroflexota bacterium]